MIVIQADPVDHHAIRRLLMSSLHIKETAGVVWRNDGGAFVYIVERRPGSEPETLPEISIRVDYLDKVMKEPGAVMVGLDEIVALGLQAKSKP